MNSNLKCLIIGLTGELVYEGNSWYIIFSYPKLTLHTFGWCSYLKLPFGIRIVDNDHRYQQKVPKKYLVSKLQQSLLEPSDNGVKVRFNIFQESIGRFWNRRYTYEFVISDMNVGIMDIKKKQTIKNQ